MIRRAWNARLADVGPVALVLEHAVQYIIGVAADRIIAQVVERHAKHAL